ncbi:MAG: hypothetical protein WBA28_01980, partial [Microbacteriaceae bacterium]
MTMKKHALFALAVLSALFLGTGCSPEVGLPPVPRPSVEPLFASDEEALAAVVEHYQEYLAVSDEVYADGGANPERLKPYVSAERYEEELSGAQSFQARGDV